MPSDADMALRQRAKAMMRKRFRGLRMAVPRAGLATRSRAAGERLLGLPAIASAASVALFWPMAKHREIDLRWLSSQLRAAGKALAYPAIDDKSMIFRQVDADEALVERGHGFAEPPDDAPEAQSLDVICVPGIAFDERGHRIGYGAGYYDRALPRLCPPAVAIGVAFDFQLAADIPHTDHDFSVAMVVTDRRTLVV